ncbi:unnamed protein product [Medioppia subpectinata]|uniref:Uncharacterized protein n=1 Tax=Medioppia subpectinata TaxID=1979941 RepID=A0A7R9L0X2_9ACAR|nr:unnamed protein product [Medioppia subpectinata]CAG2113434.1 unnamed protein product [Medioppia subpectinata]
MIIIMWLLVSIPVITINGQWFTYLTQFWKLWSKRRQQKTNRVITHDVWKENINDTGILPFPHEWDYDLPTQQLNW